MRERREPSPSPMEKQTPPYYTSVQRVAQEQRQARVMNKLKEAVLHQLSNSSHSPSQQANLSKQIEARLPSLFPSPFRIPNHPPYAEMIIRAIRDLKKKRGSSEASISRFIELRYKDLPFAHSRLLNHHLQKLVQVGEIVSVNKSCFALPNPDPNCEGEQQLVVVEEENPLGCDDGNQMGEIEVDPMCGDDNVGGGLMLPPKGHSTAAIEMKAMGGDNDNVGGGLTLPPKEHPVAAIEMEAIGGDDDNVGGGLTVIPEEHQMGEIEVERRNDDNDGGGLMILPEEHQTGEIEVERMNGDGDDNVGGVLTILPKEHQTGEIEVVEPLQKKMARRARGKPKKNEVERHEENVEKISEVMQSTADDDVDNNPAVGVKLEVSQEKRKRRGRRPKKCEAEQQQKEPATKDDHEGDGALVPLNQPSMAVVRNKKKGPTNHQEQQMPKRQLRPRLPPPTAVMKDDDDDDDDGDEPDKKRGRTNYPEQQRRVRGRPPNRGGRGRGRHRKLN